MDEDLNAFGSKPELSMLCNSRCRRTISASLSSLVSSFICGPEGGELDFLVEGDLDRDLDLDRLEDRDRLLLDDFLFDFRFRSLLEDADERSLLESLERLALLLLLFFDLWRDDLLDDLEESVELDLERDILLVLDQFVLMKFFSEVLNKILATYLHNLKPHSVARSWTRYGL